MKAYNSRNYFSMSLYKYNLKFGLGYYNLDLATVLQTVLYEFQEFLLLTEAPLKGRDFPALLRKICQNYNHGTAFDGFQVGKFCKTCRGMSTPKSLTWCQC